MKILFHKEVDLIGFIIYQRISLISNLSCSVSVVRTTKEEYFGREFRGYYHVCCLLFAENILLVDMFTNLWYFFIYFVMILHKLPRKSLSHWYLAGELDQIEETFKY